MKPWLTPELLYNGDHEVWRKHDLPSRTLLQTAFASIIRQIDRREIGVTYNENHTFKVYRPFSVDASQALKVTFWEDR